MIKTLNTSRNGLSNDPGQKSQAFWPYSYPFSIDEKMPFVFAASWVSDETKNMSTLEAVAPRLPWPIYVTGDKQVPGDPTPQQHLNMVGRLDFEELQFWFAWASIYVLPAHCNPSHLSVLHAARAGCALVLSDLPSLRDVWGSAALYVPPEDLEALEVALVLLIVDSTYRNIMAKRALACAHKFASGRRGANYLSVYRGVISGYPQRIS